MKVTFVDTAHRLRVLRARPLRPDRALPGRTAVPVHRAQPAERRGQRGLGSTTLARREVILDDDNNAAGVVPDDVDAGRAGRRPPVRLLPARQRRLLGRHARASTSSAAATWSTASPASCTGRSRASAPTPGASGPPPRNPATFTVANPRPATPPAVGGAIKAVGMNLLNYFTTIDTTASNSTGPCGPSGDPGLPRRRQRRRAQPPARARLDRHLHAERRRLRLHGAREHHAERHHHRPPRRGQRPLRRRPSLRLRRTPAARSAPTPSACSRSTAPASSRRSARRWSTSTRSTTGRRRRRRSTSSTRRTRRSASASRSIANHFKSKG